MSRNNSTSSPPPSSNPGGKARDFIFGDPSLRGSPSPSDDANAGFAHVFQTQWPLFLAVILACVVLSFLLLCLIRPRGYLRRMQGTNARQRAEQIERQTEEDKEKQRKERSEYYQSILESCSKVRLEVRPRYDCFSCSPHVLTGRLRIRRF